MMKLIVLFLLISLGSQAQMTGEWYPPFNISTRDTNSKETGYFKFNPETKVVTTRGTLKASFTFFYFDVWLPMRELDNAKLQIVRQIKEDGTIRDTTIYKQAIMDYILVRKKYGWRE